jgi:glycerophosphoryl diester phosphodiesterase
MSKKHSAMFSSDFFKGIAHRGLHDLEHTENSLLAFQRAIDYDFAFELDIHLTKDGQLIVCHDSDLIRTTGKEGVIEDLTFNEVKNGYKLLDGETVPSFQEVLDLDKERKLILVELKVYKKNYKPLAKAARKALSSIKDKTKIVIISFDPRALLFMKRGGFARGLLIGEEKEWIWCFRNFFESVDLEKTMLAKKKVQRYAKRHMINAWTIETIEEFDSASKISDGLTFQNIDPELVQIHARSIKT